MQNTTKNYKLEINKPSREFECKITIGNNIYNNDELVNLTLEHTQTQEGFSIGDTISQSLDLTLLNRGDIIYSTSQIKVEIGLKIGSTIEYILMGIFNIDDIEKTDYTTKFTAYDNMIKFETPYFSSLGDKPTLKQVVNELSKITGIEFIGSLPNYTVSKLEGFTCREVLSYVASICGGNAVITRDGKFTIKSLSEIKKSIDGNNYFDYKREEVKYKIGKISCQIDENNILYKGSTGTDSMELGFENPWVTETILNDLYNKLNGLSYLGYSMKWQGDLSLDPYDIVTVTDIKNVIRKIPILSQKISYTGGLTSEIGAKGESKNKNSFSSSGSTSNKVNRVVMEQAVIKEALINKANIRDLEASNAKIENLQVKAASIESAIIGVAYISDLTAINANIQNLIAADAKINTALINKADITELNAVQGNITSLNSQIANIQTLVNGNLSSENIQAGGITSDKLTIANGFITNAMIANLDVSKINAGNISTNKFRIVSDNGGIEIVGATQQFKDKNNKVRIQMGQDAKGNFNFILRGEDGTTTLIDNTGIKEKAIADNLIKGNMVATDAIGEKQINYSSLITGLNKDTNTQLIKASKVAIDLAGQTLDLAFNSLKNQADNNRNIIENHSTNISAMQGQISTAINNTQIVKDGKTILLKDDYNRTISKVDSINSTIGTHTTKINELTGNITSVDTKVNSVQRDLEGTKSTVSSHTNLIDGLNSKVSTQGSSIEQLKNQITLKVNSTELTTMKNELIGKFDSIEIGGRNILLNATGNLGNTNHWLNVVLDTSKKVEGCNSFKITRTNCVVGNPRHQGFQTIDLSRLSLQADEYITLSGWVYVDSSVPLGGSSNNFAFRNIYNNSNSYEDLCVFNYGNIPVNTWTKFSVTSKATKASCKAGQLLLSIGGNGLIWVSKLKLEKGNKSTDFTIAPEDINLIIDKKANSVDVYKKSETYTKSETNSAIKVAKDNIEIGISEKYETKTNIENRINTAMDNIQVGGRNLAKNSIIIANSGSLDKSDYIQSGTLISTINGVNQGFRFDSQSIYEANQQYVLSFCIQKQSGIIEQLGMTHNGKKHKDIKVVCDGILKGDFSEANTSVGAIMNDGNVHKIEIYFTASSDIPTDSGVAYTYIQLNKATGTPCSAKITKFKLEKGTKPTDWTSAPEDINTIIDSKANSSDIYNKSETYTKTETDSKITVAKDEINLGVKNTYETKTNVETKVNNAVTGLKVGGSNLLRNGNFAYDMANWSIHDMDSEGTAKSVAIGSSGSWIPEGKKAVVIRGTNTTDRYGVISSSMKLTPNTEYTISGYCAGHRVKKIQVNVRDVQNASANIHTLNINPVRGGNTLDKWYRFETTFTTTANTSYVVNLYSVNFADNGYTWFTDIQLQQGTKATAWTPCSEDIDSSINSKANSNDVYKKTEVYTKAETNSQINVAKDQINLSVSGTYETKTNVESKINTAKANAINSAKSYTDGQITTVNKTITNKVAEIKATTDSISQKVSTTESKITTINNNISGLTNRVSTAESKLTSTSLTTTISSAITAGTSSISTTQFVMDKNGLTIKNGALTIKNKAGTTVLNSDTDGNLLLTGTIKSQSGERYVSLNSGGITFNDYHKNEQMLRIAISYFTANRDINGVTFAMPSYSDFIRFSHISKTDITNGWSSTDTQYQFFDLWSGDQNINGSAMKKGMTVYSPLYIKNKATFSNTIELLNDGTPHQITLRTSASDGLANAMGIYGNDGVDIGYRSGTSNYSRIRIIESSFTGTDDQIKSWGNYNFCGYTFHNAHIVAKSLSVQGSKNCLQDTKNYGSRLINAYETAEYYFGDLGFGKINEDGECVVYIDDILLECVNTDVEYHVFTQAYIGLIQTIEKYKTYFIVKGEPETSFSWELKAKRIGYENNRLDTQEIEKQAEEKVELFGDEDFKVKTSENILMSIMN